METTVRRGKTGEPSTEKLSTLFTAPIFHGPLLERLARRLGLRTAGHGRPLAAGARAAGQHNMMGISPRQRQINFEQRIKEQEALLRSLISTLRLQLPEEEIKGVYEPGDQYAFYRDACGSLVAADGAILQSFYTVPTLHALCPLNLKS